MNLRIARLVLPLVLGCSVSFAAVASHHAVQQNLMSFQQAFEAIEKAGYQNIHKIELNHDRYCVEAFDANGKEVKFHIDAKTGAVSQAKALHHKKHAKHHAKHVKHAKHHVKAAEAAEDASKQ